MKTILTSIAAGSLLAMLAVAQPPHSAVDRARVFGQAEIQPASSKADPTATAPLYGRRGLARPKLNCGGQGYFEALVV